MNYLRCIGLFFTFTGRVHGFISTQPTSRPIPYLTNILPVSDHSTSLHVGVSYGPPMDYSDGSNTLQVRQRFYSTSTTHYQVFDVDPAFQAISIAAYPEDSLGAQRTLQKRKWTKALLGAIVVASSALLAQRIPALLNQLPYLYKAYPLKASVATCGFNSILANTISQCKSTSKDFQWRQLCSSLIYGALCLGIGTNLVYTRLMPALFPGSGIGTVLSQACLDNFVCAPFLWLPPAYMIKAAVMRQSVLEALQQYGQAVRHEKLLLRYWCMWIPAQGLTFGVVPKHLRVLCTAAFSFVWFFILSKITNSTQDES